MMLHTTGQGWTTYERRSHEIPTSRLSSRSMPSLRLNKTP